MTVDEYMKINVQGRLTFNIIQSGHKSRLDKVIKEKGMFKYVIYKDGSSYILHFKIPSESKENVVYDSILKLSPKNSLLSSSIKDYEFQFFSNSPDFVYFYCNLFYKVGMFIEELSEKLPNECFEIEPSIRNPENDISNCKSLYWILLLLHDLNLENKSKLNSISLKLDKNSFINSIKDFSIIKIEISKSDTNKRKKTNKQNTNNNLNIVNKNKSNKTFIKKVKNDTFKKLKFNNKITNNIKKK